MSIIIFSSQPASSSSSSASTSIVFNHIGSQATNSKAATASHTHRAVFMAMPFFQNRKASEVRRNL
jgi:hypothetical protein